LELFAALRITKLLVDNALRVLVYGEKGGLLVYSIVEEGLAVTQPVTLPARARGRQIAIDPSGTAHLVWEDDDSGILYAIEDEGGFEDPYVLSVQGGNPSIAIGADGDVHVVLDGGKSFPEQTGPLIYRLRQRGAWSEPKAVAADTGWVGAPTLAASLDGSLHLIYLSAEDAKSCQLKWVMKQPGSTWTEPVVLSTDEFPPFAGELWWTYRSKRAALA